jgi:hypothetical protein
LREILAMSLFRSKDETLFPLPFTSTFSLPRHSSEMGDFCPAIRFHTERKRGNLSAPLSFQCRDGGFEISTP